MKHLYIILFVLPLIGFGQGWEQTFGGIDGDSGNSVQQTSDGGYVITGTTYTLDNQYQIYLIKTDENGELEWEQTYGGTGTEQGFSVQQTSDGGYIILGNVFSGNEDIDFYLIKTDENGEEDWSQIFGGTEFDYGYSVQQTTDGGYIMTGRTSSFENMNQVYLIKTNGFGNEEWSQTFGGEESDYGMFVQQTSDGGYIITGNTQSFGNGQYQQPDIYLIKTNGFGNEEWSQTFGGLNSDNGYSIQQTNDGGYIISGNTSSFGNGTDIYLIKTNGFGNEEWSQTLGGISYDDGKSVQQTNDGGYIITGGTIDTVSYSLNVYLTKTDTSGVEQWTKIFGGLDSDRGRSVQQTTDGGYIITGDTESFGNGQPYLPDVYLIKTDSDGNTTFTSTIELPTPTGKRELVKTTNILGQENTTIKNQPMIEIYDDGSTEKKIVIE